MLSLVNWSWVFGLFGLFVAFLIYQLIMVVRGTRAASVLAGIKQYGWSYAVIDMGWYMANPMGENYLINPNCVDSSAGDANSQRTQILNAPAVWNAAGADDGAHSNSYSRSFRYRFRSLIPSNWAA